jgi:hypothetical protein
MPMPKSACYFSPPPRRLLVRSDIGQRIVRNTLSSPYYFTCRLVKVHLSRRLKPAFRFAALTGYVSILHVHFGQLGSARI